MEESLAQLTMDGIISGLVVLGSARKQEDVKKKKERKQTGQASKLS